MPFKSEKQRRYLYSQEPEVAKKWAKETPKGKKLPMYSVKAASGSGRIGRRLPKVQ